MMPKGKHIPVQFKVVDTLIAENEQLRQQNAALLEACEVVLSSLRRWRDEKPALWDAMIDVNMMVAWDALKAAIAAARGEER